MLAELEEEAVIDDASLLDAGVVTVSLHTVGLPLLGLIERPDGVPSAQAPGPEPVAVLPSSLATYQAEAQQLEKERKAEKEKAARRKERVERAGQSAPVTGKPLEEASDSTISVKAAEVARDGAGNELNLDVPGLPLVGMIARTNGVPTPLPPLLAVTEEAAARAKQAIVYIAPGAPLVYEDGVDAGIGTGTAVAADSTGDGTGDGADTNAADTAAALAAAEEKRLSVPGLPLRPGVAAPGAISAVVSPRALPPETAVPATPVNKAQQAGVSIRPGLAAPQDFSASS